MKLEGELQEIDLFRHLLELGEARFTGAIRFEHDAIIKILYFKEGEVLSASTNDRADSVDEILLRAGKVSRDHIRQALGRRKENETLGDALLGLGFITRKELAWARRAQIVGIVRSIQQWPAGGFQVVQDYLPKREEGTSFHLPQILLELVVTDPDRAAVERLVEGGTVVFTKPGNFRERFERLALNEDADAIAEKIDGERTAAEIAASSGLETFAVYKLLLALEKLGLLRSSRPEGTLEVLGAGVALRPLIDGPLEPPLGALAGLEDEPPTPTGGATFDDDAVEIRPDPEWEAPPAGEQLLDREPGLTAGGEAVERGRSGRNGLLLILILLVVLGGGAWVGYRWLAPGEATEPAGAGAEMEQQPVEPSTASETTEIPFEPPLESPSTGTVAEQTPAEAQTPRVTTAPAVSEVAPPPVTPVAESPDPLRRRYQEMAERFSVENRATEYTVQFEIVCETDSVTKALAVSEKVWFVPIRYRERPCFRIFWGRYSNREEAERARGEIPAAFRGSGPVVVRPREILR